MWYNPYTTLEYSGELQIKFFDRACGDSWEYNDVQRCHKCGCITKVVHHKKNWNSEIERISSSTFKCQCKEA
jgi:hypothetical protein